MRNNRLKTDLMEPLHAHPNNATRSHSSSFAEGRPAIPRMMWIAALLVSLQSFQFGYALSCLNSALITGNTSLPDLFDFVVSPYIYFQYLYLCRLAWTLSIPPSTGDGNDPKMCFENTDDEPTACPPGTIYNDLDISAIEAQVTSHST